LRWLITGATGMLGSDLHQQLRERDADSIAVGRAELDVTDRDAVLYLLKQVRPSVIVNCAAYTKVDDCETNEALAAAVNGTAVEALAEGANRWNSLLVHLSTDFVFNGEKSAPYEINDRVEPLSAYGRTKLAGEEAARTAWRHLIVRTSWLFGPHGWNFVEAIRRQVLSGKSELRVVNDQLGRPTYTPHLASALIRLGTWGAAETSSPGTFHYADEPECSWFDFACEIVEAMREEGTAGEVSVQPISSADITRPAIRPAYSVLSTARYERVTAAQPESWADGLREYLATVPGQ
jgi:dTDP-4-dehydrorhamnose reductase